MSSLHTPITIPDLPATLSVEQAKTITKNILTQHGYHIVEQDESKPWGAYYRIANDQAVRFLEHFFPGLSPHDAHLGRDDIEISPKFLLVKPAQRLSWQYHDRRAERWRFLTSGGFYCSMNDQESERYSALVDTVVQFVTGERHRLCADNDAYTLVAEIWQHTNPDEPSNEADITRLADDYKR